MPIKARWCLAGQDEAESLFKARFAVEGAGVPDYVIHDATGRELLQYPDAVRICLSLDGLVPDYNLPDYGISPDPLVFGDRHLCLQADSNATVWLDFIAAIFDRPKDRAFRRDRAYWGKFCEASQSLLAKAPVELQQARTQHQTLSQTASQMARIVERRKGTGQ